MVSDRELLTQSLESYVLKTTEKLFGITSGPAQVLLKYGVRNMIDKYGAILDIFTTKDGELNVPILLDAVGSEIKSRGGLKIWNIKFTEKDISEILELYTKLRDGNV
jgi:hypothetical protein